MRCVFSRHHLLKYRLTVLPAVPDRVVSVDVDAVILHCLPSWLICGGHGHDHLHCVPEWRLLSHRRRCIVAGLASM